MQRVANKQPDGKELQKFIFCILVCNQKEESVAKVLKNYSDNVEYSITHKKKNMNEFECKTAKGSNETLEPLRKQSLENTMTQRNATSKANYL